VPDRPRTLRRPRPCVPTAGPRRASAHARGYTRAWQRFRLRVLADVGRVDFPCGGPLCCECGDEATDVDHVRPHKGDAGLMYANENVQSLCHECHSRKTAREDGGFGRPVVPQPVTGG
jgi:5-methylcytosine-specific restriction protein A